MYVPMWVFLEFGDLAVFSVDLGEYFRFIGYPVSTGVLYFILYYGVVYLY